MAASVTLQVDQVPHEVHDRSRLADSVLRTARGGEWHRAVVDRISDGWAILLVGDDETERRVREDDLAEGVREGSIVEVRLSGSRVEIVGVDEDATDRARGEVADRLARLRKTRSSRRFDTNRPDPT